MAELLRRGLEAPPEAPTDDPVQAWRDRLVFHADGSVTNPDGIDDEAFFEAVQQVRDADRVCPPHDPFAERE